MKSSLHLPPSGLAVSNGPNFFFFNTKPFFKKPNYTPLSVSASCLQHLLLIRTFISRPTPHLSLRPLMKPPLTNPYLFLPSFFFPQILTEILPESPEEPRHCFFHTFFLQLIGHGAFCTSYEIISGTGPHLSKSAEEYFVSAFLFSYRMPSGFGAT